MGRESSLRPRPSDMTVGRWMIVAIISALSFSLARMTDEPKLTLWIGLGLFSLIVSRILVMILYARRCTVCGKGPVGMVTAVPFGDHFYWCAMCGQRSKRFWLGRLWDASGPNDAHRFQKGGWVETWDDSAIVPTPDRPETRTVGGLLESKLDRLAESPSEPIDVGTIPSSNSLTANPPAPGGVELPVTERYARTLDAIRWSRRSRS